MDQVKELSESEKLQARLVELREARKAREEKLQLFELEDEIAREERDAKMDEQLEKFSAKYGRHSVKAVPCKNPANGFVIVKAPALPTYRKFQDSGDSTDSQESLVSPCRVFPELEAFDRIMTLEPAMLLDCANAVCELGGVKIGKAAKK